MQGPEVGLNVLPQPTDHLPQTVFSVKIVIDIIISKNVFKID